MSFICVSAWCLSSYAFTTEVTGTTAVYFDARLSFLFYTILTAGSALLANDLQVFVVRNEYDSG